MIKISSCLAGTLLALAAFHVQAADVSLGESIYSQSCAQCHGRSGAGSGSFPSVAGQEEEYIANRLIQYREGENVGPNSGLMRAPTRDLSDDDIAGLAAYISTTFQ